MFKLYHYNKKYNRLLIYGLSLLVLGIILAIITHLLGSDDVAQRTILSFSKSYFRQSKWLCILLLCVISPVLEEMGFRLWARRHSWTMVVSVVVMSLFCLMELGVWSLLLTAGIGVLWFSFKRPVRRNYIVAFASSAIYSACHFASMGHLTVATFAGMMIDMGFGITLCWVVVAISFWAALVIHVGIAVLQVFLPMIFTPASTAYAGLNYAAKMEPVNPFADNRFIDVDATWDPHEKTQQVTLVGEPAEIAYLLHGFACATGTCNDRYIYDWQCNQSRLENRQVLTIDFDSAVVPNFNTLLADYRKAVNLHYDTVDVNVCSIWLLYPEGGAQPLEDREDAWVIYSKIAHATLGVRSNVIWREETYNPDKGDSEWRYWCVPYTNRLVDEIFALDGSLDGCKLDFRVDHKAQMIIAK